MWAQVKDCRLDGRNRLTSSGYGTEDLGLTSKGTKLQRLSHRIDSGVIGYFDRTVRMPYCRKCAWCVNNPEKWARMQPMFAKISNTFREVWPEKWEYQKGVYDQINEDFKIPGTIFTTITINHNYRTACHQDGKNLDGAVTAMVLLRHGQYEGGHLVLPKYRVAFRMDTGDVAFFNAAEEWHGNTPLIPITKECSRCTLVCYLRKNMVSCGSIKEELELAKHRQKGFKLK